MRIFHKFSKIEKLLIIFLFLAVFFSVSKIFYNFFEENSTSKADFWWTYSESLVWDVNFLNPVFSNLNKIDKDVWYFLFRWLMKYEWWEIADDIATHTLSEDKLTYTFKVKDEIFWHNWDLLTVDDIYYTYHDVLQSPDFENKNFALWLVWVEINKISENEITFKLKKPYKFFLSNLNIWILPKKVLAWIPVENLKYSEFNFDNPVWLWPYKFAWIQNFWTYKKIFLTKNKNFYDKSEKFYIENLEFLIYPDKESQKNDADNFLWFGPVQKNLSEKNNEKNFELSWFENYEMNQRKSVWLFLNTESVLLKNQMTRLWLQLSIDKNSILEKIWEKKIVNTPFLEIKNDWTFDFDQQKARWALHESGWKSPKKIEIKKEENIAKNTLPNYIFSHNKNIFATWSWSFFLNWNAPEKSASIYFNDYELRQYSPWWKIFSYKLDTKIWTLKEWENNFIIKSRLQTWEEMILDVMRIFYYSDEKMVLSKQKDINNWEIRWILKEIKDEKEIEKNLNLAEKFNFRINEKWEILKLKLITDKRFEKYWVIAEELKKYFAEVWVDLEIQNLEFEEFIHKLNKREYDILLYWQSLWYNPDTYPFFHSSEAGEWWLNFSNLKNPEFDILIEKIRSSHDTEKRKTNLKLLEEKFKTVVPAIYFYSPTYYYQVSNHVKWVEFWEIVNYIDRFEKFANWYVNEEKKIKDEVWFFSWVVELFFWNKEEVKSWSWEVIETWTGEIIETWSGKNIEEK